LAVQFGNNLSTRLTVGAASTDTLLQVQGVGGWPALTGGDHMWVTLEDSTAIEIVRVEGYQGNGLVVSTGGRGADGTTAIAWPIGAVVEVRVCRALLQDIQGGGTGTVTHSIWHGALQSVALADFTVADLASLTADAGASGTQDLTFDATALADGWTTYIVTLAPSMISGVTTSGFVVTNFTDPANRRDITDSGDTYHVYSIPNQIGGITITYTVTFTR